MGLYFREFNPVNITFASKPLLSNCRSVVTGYIIVLKHMWNVMWHKQLPSYQTGQQLSQVSFCCTCEYEPRGSCLKHYVICRFRERSELPENRATCSRSPQQNQNLDKPPNFSTTFGSQLSVLNTVLSDYRKEITRPTTLFSNEQICTCCGKLLFERCRDINTQ